MDFTPSNFKHKNRDFMLKSAHCLTCFSLKNVPYLKGLDKRASRLPFVGVARGPPKTLEGVSRTPPVTRGPATPLALAALRGPIHEGEAKVPPESLVAEARGASDPLRSRAMDPPVPLVGGVVPLVAVVVPPVGVVVPLSGSSKGSPSSSPSFLPILHM